MIKEICIDDLIEAIIEEVEEFDWEIEIEQHDARVIGFQRHGAEDDARYRLRNTIVSNLVKLLDREIKEIKDTVGYVSKDKYIKGLADGAILQLKNLKFKITNGVF